MTVSSADGPQVSTLDAILDSPPESRAKQLKAELRQTGSGELALVIRMLGELAEEADSLECWATAVGVAEVLRRELARRH